jgi:hypothetical protein
MVGTGLKVLIADAILLLAEYFVVQDVQARVGCALGSPLYGSQCLTRASPGYSYSILTESFSMIINGTGVVSPSMLDWTQLIAAVLIAVNVWYVYVVIKSKPGLAGGRPLEAPPSP